MTIVGESVHTAFRKGTDGPGAHDMWLAIQALDPDTWNQALGWIAYCLEECDVIKPLEDS